MNDYQTKKLKTIRDSLADYKYNKGHMDSHTMALYHNPQWEDIDFLIRLIDEKINGDTDEEMLQSLENEADMNMQESIYDKDMTIKRGKYAQTIFFLLRKLKEAREVKK